MVGILAQVDDIFSWAPRGGKLIGTGWGMRIQGHGYLNILCRCNIRRSARWQREHGFLLDQHYQLLSFTLILRRARIYNNEATNITDTTYQAGSPEWAKGGERRRSRAGLNLPKRCASAFLYHTPHTQEFSQK